MILTQEENKRRHFPIEVWIRFSCLLKRMLLLSAMHGRKYRYILQRRSVTAFEFACLSTLLDEIPDDRAECQRQPQKCMCLVGTLACSLATESKCHCKAPTRKRERVPHHWKRRKVTGATKRIFQQQMKIEEQRRHCRFASDTTICLPLLVKFRVSRSYVSASAWLWQAFSLNNKCTCIRQCSPGGFGIVQVTKKLGSLIDIRDMLIWIYCKIEDTKSGNYLPPYHYVFSVMQQCTERSKVAMIELGPRATRELFAILVWSSSYPVTR